MDNEGDSLEPPGVLFGKEVTDGTRKSRNKVNELEVKERILLFHPILPQARETKCRLA